MRPEPGFYRECPRATYDAWDAINFSTLKFMQWSPAHAYQQRVHPPEPTAALAFGQALHVAVLEPELWTELYVCGPEGDRRSKAVLEEWRRIEQQHPRATVLRPQDHAEIERIAQTVRSRSDAYELLVGDGHSEASFVWVDPPTGILCKGRIDRIARAKGWSAIVDLKSTGDARPWAFASACAKYDYHAQAAWYLDGLNQVEPHERRFLFIAVEKRAPYGTSVYELGSASIELGRRRWRAWLDAWARCEADGEWPAYPDGIAPLELPEWAWKQEAGETLDDEAGRPADPF